MPLFVVKNFAKIVKKLAELKVPWNISSFLKVIFSEKSLKAKCSLKIMKNVFYFTLKVLFVPKIFKFLN